MRWWSFYRGTRSRSSLVPIKQEQLRSAPRVQPQQTRYRRVGGRWKASFLPLLDEMRTGGCGYPTHRLFPGELLRYRASGRRRGCRHRGEGSGAAPRARVQWRWCRCGSEREQDARAVNVKRCVVNAWDKMVRELEGMRNNRGKMMEENGKIE